MDETDEDELYQKFSDLKHYIDRIFDSHMPHIENSVKTIQDNCERLNKMIKELREVQKKGFELYKVRKSPNLAWYDMEEGKIPEYGKILVKDIYGREEVVRCHAKLLIIPPNSKIGHPCLWKPL